MQDFLLALAATVKKQIKAYFQPEDKSFKVFLSLNRRNVVIENKAYPYDKKTRWIESLWNKSAPVMQIVVQIQDYVLSYVSSHTKERPTHTKTHSWSLR